MVFIRMLLVWNAIENWICDRERSRLCNEPLNGDTYKPKPYRENGNSLLKAKDQMVSI